MNQTATELDFLLSGAPATIEPAGESTSRFGPRVLRDPLLGVMRSLSQGEIARELDAEIIGGTDERTRVRNTLRPPMRYICMLELDFGPDPAARTRNIIARGTGTLISSRHVLTAGHNLFNRITVSGRRVLRGVQSLRVSPAHDGRARKPAPFARVPSRGWRYATNWQRGRDMQFDFGLITLARPIAGLRDAGDRPLGFWGSGLAPGTRPLRAIAPRSLGARAIHISGYPGDKCLDRPRVGAASAAQIAACPAGGWASTQWQASGRVTNPAPRGAPRLLLYDLDTKGGHSGSPLWLDSGHLVAVHTGPGDVIPGERRDSSNRGVRITRQVLGDLARWGREPPVTPAPRSALRLGARGLAVFELQTRLNLWSQFRRGTRFPLLTVDGILGRRTRAGVLAFQKAQRLRRDGVVGTRTWAALDRALRP